jgi:AcrR family transcriptional regulator
LTAGRADVNSVNIVSDTRERIVVEARDLYLTEGLAGLSMRKVAERVGVTATALYRHFEDKQALLLAVVQTGFERFTSYLLRGLAGKTPGARLARTGEGYLRFALENPADYRIMFMSMREDLGYDRFPARSKENLSRSFQLLVDRTRECQEAGLVRSGDPHEIAVLIWSFVHGLVSLYLAGHMGPLGRKPEAFARFYAAAQAEFLLALHP